jgi:hypothetical protein
MEHQRWRDRVAQTDHRIAPSDGPAVRSQLYTKGSGLFRDAQFICGTVDFGFCLRHRRGVGFGPDADVDESAD